ncbi:hypothetical protein [Natranaeroarchaeum aerophilus]|uniref:Uncharacterized protein n=1 Tax=Natranaeroarchaeum aerophilus TaxID=2917711 RepID=A0AAE3FRH1_9EURY|nr:hypothetical protein [Natranaeroarchaeum aerophilus]MCL9814247.1 hypothetical protein [Natranaeroarchaeum aerophilus]
MSQTMSSDETGSTMEAGADTALIASVVSVGLALYAYFARGDRELGIFVGLWAPTILTLSNHFKQRDIEQQLQSMPLAGSSGNVRETIEELIQSRS